MAYKPRFGSKLREQVWQLECLAAYKAERSDGTFPICVHCDRPVMVGQMWDRSHVTVPRAFGGKEVGVGHSGCNQQDNNQVVTPMAAKASEVRKKHVGIKGPGLGHHPLPGGRRSDRRVTMGRGVQPRRRETHQEFIARRFFIEVDDIDGAIEVHP